MSQHADEKRSPASMTKIMTAMLMFDALDEDRAALDDPIHVSEQAADTEGSRLGLRAGDDIRFEDAIYALTVRSANDVAVAVAEHLGGSEQAFTDMMDQKARAIGMTDTNFGTASGLDHLPSLPNGEQRTTADDMAKMVQHLLKHYTKHLHYFSQQRFQYNGETYRNTNRLAPDYPGKTGTTSLAGSNLAAWDADSNIAIMMGCPSSKDARKGVIDVIADMERYRQPYWPILVTPKPSTEPMPTLTALTRQ